MKSVTTPDCNFGGGNAIACKIPAGLAPNETLNLVEPSAILVPTEQHMVDDSVVAGNISCGGEDETLEAVNLDEDHLPWEALNHEAQMASVEDPNNCNERVVQLLCNETLNGAPLLQVAEVLLHFPLPLVRSESTRGNKLVSICWCEFFNLNIDCYNLPSRTSYLLIAIGRSVPLMLAALWRIRKLMK